MQQQLAANEERRGPDVGYVPPNSRRDGQIRCSCGYEGPPLKVVPWPFLASGHLGLCRCGSSRAVWMPEGEGES
ncbi:MAG: hypothetical protein EA351_00030 [Gemmatimonadales bacterium]|nr:MAG: hypothetical protein EA351_00030 [Gemmatimonadales bacterium]